MSPFRLISTSLVQRTKRLQKTHHTKSMGARKCSRHYMAKHGTESLYENQTSVKQVVALPNPSLLALAPRCSASGERCQGACGHVTQHTGSGHGRHGQSTPSPEHTWSKLQPCSGHGKGNPPATICGQPHSLAPKPAAPPTLLPAVGLQWRLPRKVFAGGSGLPQLPLAVMLC